MGRHGRWELGEEISSEVPENGWLGLRECVQAYTVYPCYNGRVKQGFRYSETTKI